MLTGLTSILTISAKKNHAFLRCQVDIARIQFIDSIAKGGPIVKTGRTYIGALTNYREALSSEAFRSKLGNGSLESMAAGVGRSTHHLP